MTKREFPDEIRDYEARLKVEPPLRLELVRPFHAMLCDGSVVVDARYLVPGEFGGTSTVRLSVDVVELVELQNAIRTSLAPSLDSSTN